MSKWQPAETPPPLGVTVLIYEDPFVLPAEHDGNRWWVMGWSGHYTVNPTHWQEFPEGPDA